MSSQGDNSDLLITIAKAREAQGQSLPTFLASLATSVILCGVVSIAVVTAKPALPQSYRAGSYLHAALEGQTTAAWPRMAIFPMPDPNPAQILQLENYFFDRYIHTLLRIFIVLTLTLLPMLLPLNILEGKDASGGVTGMDRLSFANVGLAHTDRYWVHLLAAIFVVLFVCFILQFELQSYSRFQEASAATRVEGTSILVVSASATRLTCESIQHHFGNVSSGIQTIRMNRDYRSIHGKIRQRTGLIANLEAAETCLIKKAQHSGTNTVQPSQAHRIDQPRWKGYLCDKDRPTMRLSPYRMIPSLPFIGKKVDAIYHCRSEIVRLCLEIEREKRQPNAFPPLNSAFVHFDRRLSIPLPLLALKTQIPPSWTLKHGTIHSDIIWSNISTSWWGHLSRSVVIYFLIIALILACGLPISVTGTLSQISYLTGHLSWLSSLDRIPHWLLGVIQGVFPPTILALITALVPAVLRVLANLQGFYSRQAVERALQTYYFVFLFIQVFLVVSLSSSITTVVVKNVHRRAESIPVILVQNLPKASNYFFSYLVLNASATVTSTLLLPKEWLSILLSPILDKSSRQKWARREDLHLKPWGTFVPVYTNLACIGLIYSVIAPLILAISTSVFGAFWILYRNNPPRLSDSVLNSRGQFYPVAIRQMFTSLYFMELSLAGLFFLVRDANGEAACIGQATIMILAAIFTALFHLSIDSGGRPCWRSLLVCFRKPILHCDDEEAEKDQHLTRAKSNVFRPSMDEVIDNEHFSGVGHVIWIPQDSLGVAESEIYHMNKHSKHLQASTKGAHIDANGNIVVQGDPPDLRNRT